MMTLHFIAVGSILLRSKNKIMILDKDDGKRRLRIFQKKRRPTPLIFSQSDSAAGKTNKIRLDLLYFTKQSKIITIT